MATNVRHSVPASFFLRLNDLTPKADGITWEKLLPAIATDVIDRDEAVARLRKLRKGND